MTIDQKILKVAELSLDVSVNHNQYSEEKRNAIYDEIKRLKEEIKHENQSLKI